MIHPYLLLTGIVEAGTSTGSPAAGAGDGFPVTGGVHLLPVMLRLVSSLALIFFLIFALVFLLRRYGGKFTSRFSMGKHLQVIGSYSLESKKKLYLMRVFDKVILVASGPTGMWTLAQFAGDELGEVVPEGGEPAPNPITDFRKLLQKYSNKH